MSKAIIKSIPTAVAAPHEQKIRLPKDLDERLKETARTQNQTIDEVVHDALLHPHLNARGVDLREQMNVRPSNVLRTILLLPDVYEKVVGEAFRYDLSPGEIIRAKLRENLPTPVESEKPARVAKLH